MLPINDNAIQRPYIAFDSPRQIVTTRFQSQPKVSERQAEEFLKEFYGISARVSPLDSERDQNFRVESDQDHKSWVLKIANAEADAEGINLENAVMDSLQDTSVGPLIPMVFESVNKRFTERLNTSNDFHIARLVEFVAGRVLAKVYPQPDELLFDLGRQLGSFTNSLHGFQHAAATPNLGKDFHWNLDRFAETVQEFDDDPIDAKLIAPFVDRYRSRVLPVLDQLRKSLIHNDANDYNIIVSDASEWPPKVKGLIDFGDMVFGSTINELAISLAYVMLDKSDPLASASQVVKGFDLEFPILEVELSILFDLACARLCTSVIMASHQRRLNPENEYLSVTDQPARQLLSRLADVHPDFAEAQFRSACDLPPIKHAPQVESWIHKTAKSFYPLLGYALDKTNVHAFDLSVSSTDSFAGDLGSSTADELSDFLKHKNNCVGIGRYLEPRICYQGEQFQSAEDSNLETPEPRTIHMGVDLFVESGNSIHAPLDGVVHSFADNDFQFDYGPTIILEHRTSNDIPFFTLYGHLSRCSLSNLEVGQQIEKGKSFAKIGEQSENGGWAPHLHFQVMSHDLGLKGNYPGVVKASELDVWKSIIMPPYDLASIPRHVIPPLANDSEQIKTTRREVLNPSLSLSYKTPLHIVRGRKQFLYDRNGHKYLDCVNNVCHVGHCHPDVVDAASKQLGLLNTNTRYLHENITAFAQKLTQTLPEKLNTCFFVNSGSEANDLALRLAKTFTGRHETICVSAAYHGNLSSLIDISPYKYDSRGGKGKPLGTFEIPLPDSYRGIHNKENPPPDCLGTYYAKYLSEAIKESSSRVTTGSETPENHHEIAAFICESILSCGGQIVLPDRFLERAYDTCRQHGILCIADEVQVGFGRVGEKFWGFELSGVEPDIVTMGKPIGNGFPLGAVVTTKEIANAFNNGMEYFNTFGGNPVACSVGSAVLDVIESERLQENALTVGNYLINALKQLMASHSCIGDVRGKGLFIGIEFVSDSKMRTPNPALAKYVVERMKNRNILLSTDGPDENVIKIKPPICFTKEDASQLVAGLESVLQEDFPKSFLKHTV